jgi:2-dehydro-3-deoxyphosphooctonate aldolase (KDO 8-P synthase)
MSKSISIGPVKAGGKNGLFLISGPCVIESRAKCLKVARKLKELSVREGIPLVFKASYDKANRTSIDSFRGPGMEEGLDILAEVKAETGLPLLTDIHHADQAAPVAKVVDILQIPAFLCRQTDLIVAAGETGAVINLKKGQFLAPEGIVHGVRKIESTGNRKILLTERGASFGYNNLVADMRSLLIMADLGYPVVFDATHSVQRMGGTEGRTGGDGQWAPHLARAAVATGCDGLFIETHLNPAEALSDKDNAIPFKKLSALWKQLSAIDEIVT